MGTEHMDLMVPAAVSDVRWWLKRELEGKRVDGWEPQAIHVDQRDDGTWRGYVALKRPWTAESAPRKSPTWSRCVVCGTMVHPREICPKKCGKCGAHDGHDLMCEDHPNALSLAQYNQGE